MRWNWHWGASRKKRRRWRNFGDACGAMLLLGAGSRACALLGAQCVGRVGVQLPEWLAGARSVAGQSRWHPGVLFRSGVFRERLAQARRSKWPVRVFLLFLFAQLPCACGHAAILGPTCCFDRSLSFPTYFEVGLLSPVLGSMQRYRDGLLHGRAAIAWASEPCDLYSSGCSDSVPVGIRLCSLWVAGVAMISLSFVRFVLPMCLAARAAAIVGRRRIAPGVFFVLPVSGS